MFGFYVMIRPFVMQASQLHLVIAGGMGGENERDLLAAAPAGCELKGNLLKSRVS